jgi:small-conductance mechanosensitive channel/CRP-like cAMP-binding protein
MLPFFLENLLVQSAILVLADFVSRAVVQRTRVTSLIVSSVFFCILTALLIIHHINPFVAAASGGISQSIIIGCVKAIWWLGGARLFSNAIRLFLIFERKPHEGRLLQDLLVGLVYLGSALSIAAYVFNVPVGTLIATSGVFAIVLGLALQSTLSDVFSGIALNVARPYSVGDWIVLDDGMAGRVIETNWRSTYLLNGNNDKIVIPNSGLAKMRFSNQTNPDQLHGVSLKVAFLPTSSPSMLLDVMRTVLLSSNLIVRSRNHSAVITGMNNFAIDLEVSFFVAALSQVGDAKNEIFDLIFRHTKAAGLQFAFPSGLAASAAQADPATGVNQNPSTAWRLLNAIPLFATLTEDEKEVLATNMIRRTFQKEAVIFGEGTRLESLMIVRNGVIVIEQEQDNLTAEIARLAPGDCFGERGLLMGVEEPGTAKAMTFVVVYEMPKEQFAAIVRDRPSLAEELGLLLSRRLEAESNQAASRNGLQSAPPRSISERIRHLFGVKD